MNINLNSNTMPGFWDEDENPSTRVCDKCGVRKDEEQFAELAHDTGYRWEGKNVCKSCAGVVKCTKCGQTTTEKLSRNGEPYCRKCI